jgi:hypothetical protein
VTDEGRAVPGEDRPFPTTPFTALELRRLVIRHILLRVLDVPM